MYVHNSGNLHRDVSAHVQFSWFYEFLQYKSLHMSSSSVSSLCGSYLVPDIWKQVFLRSAKKPGQHRIAWFNRGDGEPLNRHAWDPPRRGKNHSNTWLFSTMENALSHTYAKVGPDFQAIFFRGKLQTMIFPPRETPSWASSNTPAAQLSLAIQRIQCECANFTPSNMISQHLRSTTKSCTGITCQNLWVNVAGKLFLVVLRHTWMFYLLCILCTACLYVCACVNAWNQMRVHWLCPICAIADTLSPLLPCTERLLSCSTWVICLHSMKVYAEASLIHKLHCWIRVSKDWNRTTKQFR